MKPGKEPRKTRRRSSIDNAIDQLVLYKESFSKAVSAMIVETGACSLVTALLPVIYSTWLNHEYDVSHAAHYYDDDAINQPAIYKTGEFL
jgi:hypothetical protein